MALTPPLRPLPAPHSTARRVFGPLAAAALALLFLLGLAAGPASAHDELSGSNPADNSTVGVVPESVELTFSSVPSGIGAQVEVLDVAGADWAEGPVKIIDNTAVQALRPGAPGGVYTVNWRVVSSDSHPIEGVLEFTAETQAAGAPDAADTAVPIDPAGSGESAAQSAGGGNPWSIAALIIVPLALAAAVGVLARKRLRQ